LQDRNLYQIVCMLTAAGALRKHLRPASTMATSTRTVSELLPDQEQDTKNAAAEGEYGVYQAHLANMLTMATLLFGFCATGTFLSVSFTGGETDMTTDNLIALVRNALHSTIASVVVTMIVFVFSARAALQYQLFGATAALQPIYKGMLFISGAEVLLYYSLICFVLSIEYFADMNYMGPNICPYTQFKDPLHLGDGSAFIISGRSFCSRVGESMYDAATQLCADSNSSLEEYGFAEGFVTRHRSDNVSWILCTMYDNYYVPGTTQASAGKFWFGWDREKNWVDPETIANFSNTLLTSSDPEWYADLREYWTQEAFLDVVTNTADKICGVQKAKDSESAHCTGTGLATTECLLALAAVAQSDVCSGAKEDDAVKCRKSCQWHQSHASPLESTKTIIEDLMHGNMKWLVGGLWLTLGCRALAGIFTTYKYLKMRGFVGWSAVGGFVDVFGIFDTFLGHTERSLGGPLSEDEEE